MNLRLLIIVPLAAIQLAVPGWMIFRQENILQHGRVFKFKTAPVDPYDAFRGRYVALRFAAETTNNAVSHNEERSVWVQFEADPQGFAKVKQASTLPLTGDDVVVAEANAGGGLTFPFDRYYMDEKDAPKADAAYHANSRRDHDNAYATVRILNGHAALEELYIDDKPIREFLRTNVEK